MSNFICEKCGMTNIDCGYQGYKTEREIELEKQLDREIKINRKMKNAISLASYYLASPNELSDDVPNEELAFQELRKVLKEINNKE